jgi:hypothetical protein
LGVEQQRAGVKREIEIDRRELAGLNCVGNGPFAIAARRKRATQVAISFDPIGMAVEQSLIGLRGFCMETAIAEEPSTAMRHALVVAGKGEGSPSAFERLGMAAFMKEGFGEAAVQPRRFRSFSVVLWWRQQAVVERAGFHGAGEGRTIDR